MNGIVGFLENSSGLYLNDTIETLERIHALQDYEIMSSIRRILVKYGMTTQQLRGNVNSQEPYEIKPRNTQDFSTSLLPTSYTRVS
ncbi:hypothetical protein LQV63_20550 [Paenibacillus profundus]|uniref:Uncharacterized protein n=1 Tax=Paenibacillus profundus TaxID=1173085 RepID=A0ABS8YID6_9BACL|nr:hypothetical protein [Paenibacillus profundus]MCE5171678.1 hypothetical protein [Paenibacillus profundus]